MKRNLKIQPRHMLTNAIFALLFSSFADEMMAHYSPHTCLKNSTCILIVYSFQFFFSCISWQAFEYFMWIIRKNVTLSMAANGYSNLQKLLMRKIKQIK